MVFSQEDVSVVWHQQWLPRWRSRGRRETGKDNTAGKPDMHTEWYHRTHLHLTVYKVYFVEFRRLSTHFFSGRDGYVMLSVTGERLEIHCIQASKVQDWCYSIFSFCQQIPWKDQNQLCAIAVVITQYSIQLWPCLRHTVLLMVQQFLKALSIVVCFLNFIKQQISILNMLPCATMCFIDVFLMEFCGLEE